MKTNDKNAYVYRHRTLDTNHIFYIGIGIVERRCWSKNGRNKYWHNVVNKHGFKHEIIASNLNREVAKELEMFLIELYGRRDLKTGQLVNMTNGGDGMNGISKEASEIKSKKITGLRRTDETKLKMSLSQSRGKHSHAKKVIDTSNGVVYDCIKDASESYGIGYHNLKDKLSGRKNAYNNTSLRYYDGNKGY